ncbi:MAG TPA: aminopeptidase P N-terminal domain-containing protein [Pyrinomonadaceae bacterium]|nr:aminopeptidase P N-terminal domain-containing protein [Pyrinomonadaceae bacterium]
MPRPQLADFMRQIGADSVAIIPSSLETTRSHDTHYRHRQDSDFFYLTGFDEPDSIAVIAPAHPEHQYMLFVRPRDPEREIWDGRRAGVEGAVRDHGAQASFPVEEFPAKLGELLTNVKNLYYRIGSPARRDLDEVVLRQIARLRTLSRKGIYAPQAIIDPASVIHEMRLVKGEGELSVMQRSVDIAADAHREAMKNTRPGMNEYEVEALIEYVFRRSGAAAPAYTSIVGGGANATVLHYINNDAELRDGDLLLVDAGAEYQGYASDITRTFPVNGRYTEAQRDVYRTVLDAQMRCIERVRPGVSMDELHNYSIELLTEGMLSLGLLTGDAKKLIEEEAYKKFYMHRLGHYLGMDVHDAGFYHVGGESRRLQPGMVITVEPGLYISESAENIPDQYRGIGIRIEDDVLVTEDGARVLSSKAPKEMDEIEELMRG